MDESETKDKGFKVEDRRRFSAEGELKPEYQGPEEREAPPAAAQTQPKAEPRAAAAEKQAAGERKPSEMSFVGFLLGLSTQVLIHLGEIPDPATGESKCDLPAAQQLIDLLGVLQDKTKGNLDRDEQSMLDSILFDVRVKYVEKARLVSA
jgi:hypothetical protein